MRKLKSPGPEGDPLARGGVANAHRPTLPPALRQYPWRCSVSRTGSRWISVGPLRSRHASTTRPIPHQAPAHIPSPIISNPHPAPPPPGADARRPASPRPPGPVCSTPRGASTAGQSPGHLPGASRSLAAWRTHLAAGFPLRCFQRFSLPDVATQHCRTPHNWSTSGLSKPVLSY